MNTCDIRLFTKNIIIIYYFIYYLLLHGSIITLVYRRRDTIFPITRSKMMNYKEGPL